MTFENVRFVLLHLLRPGEEAALSWPIGLDQEGQDTWWVFLRVRWEAWRQVIREERFDDLPVGWGHAAVRLFGRDAIVALWDLTRTDWPGREEAERYLLDRNEDVLQVRRPWDRN